MKKNVLLLGAVSAFALTGCHGLKKVSFQDFCDEVNKLKEVSPKSVKISGKVDGEKVNFTYEIPQTVGASLDSALSVLSGSYNKYEIAAAGHIESLSTYTVVESSDLTYYTGFGFKVKAEKKTIEWNSKGLTTSYSSPDASLRFSWKLN